MSSEQKKSSSIIKKILWCIVALAIGGFLSDYISKQDLGGRLAEKETKFNKELDIELEKLNKTLPKEVAPNVFLSNMRRENKIIYNTYSMPTLNTKQLLSLIDNNKKNGDKDIMFICNDKYRLKAIDNGYSFIFVYDSNEDNNVYRMVIGKKACSRKP